MEHEAFFKLTPPLSDPRSNFNGFHPGTTLLPEGHVVREKAIPLACDIIFERDVPVTLRDGTVIRVDIFRPGNDNKVPAILCSSIFGKNGSYITYDFVTEMCGHPNRVNVPLDCTSGLDGFESPDPGFWCAHDYAVVYMDPRGVGMSEGDAHYFGTQDATDNYDVIEWLAAQPWSNRTVTMGGNSWLGITQWYTAALQPPHLTCIAPWEGHANMYVDEYMRGGIPHNSIVRVNMCYGNNMMEDLPAAMNAYPLYDEYWQEKAACFEDVNVPAYVVASYTSQVHCRGTFEGFRRMSSPDKWLRVHNNQEWGDLHQPENEQDLLKFFDHFMKGIDNGWEKTPRVRMSVLDPGHEDIVYRDEETFPLERQEFRKFHLDIVNNSFSSEPVKGSRTASYVSDDARDRISFVHTFTEETEITGYIKLRLWVEAETKHDMDVYAKVSKLNARGEYVFNDGVTYQYGGPNAMLRVSLRELDEAKSTPSEPVQTFAHPEMLGPGEVVPVEMGFWPTSLLFHPGEKLELTIAGYDFLGLKAPEDNVKDGCNRGRHIVHAGGIHDSHLLIPFIPAGAGK